MIIDEKNCNGCGQAANMGVTEHETGYVMIIDVIWVWSIKILLRNEEINLAVIVEWRLPPQ